VALRITGDTGDLIMVAIIVVVLIMARIVFHKGGS
jgi:hypothetical protein